MRLNRLFTSIAVLAVLAMSSVFVSAQTGALRGQVQLKQADGTVTPVAGAQIDVYRTDIAGHYDTKTDKKGNFVFAGLPYVGTYIVAVSAPGAAPTAIPNVKAGRDQDLPITLSAGNGNRFSEAEAKSYSSAGAPANGNSGGAQASTEDKKKIEEIQKKNAEIVEKNKKIEESNKIVTESVKAGNDALNAKNYDQAITEYDKGISADPTHPGVPVLLTNKSVALRARGVDRFNKAVTTKDDAAMAAAKKDWQDAAEASGQAVKQLNESAAPTDPAQLNNFNMSKKYAYTANAEAMRFVVSKVDPSKADDGMKAYDQYIASETDAEKKHKAEVDEANMLLDAGAADKAYTAAQKLLTQNPDDVDGLLVAGLALFQTGDKAKFQEAANYLQRFVDKAPDTNKLKASAKEALDYLKSQENITPQKGGAPARRRG
jgi:hypothetical protein